MKLILPVLSSKVPFISHGYSTLASVDLPPAKVPTMSPALSTDDIKSSLIFKLLRDRSANRRQKKYFKNHAVST